MFSQKINAKNPGRSRKTASSRPSLTYYRSGAAKNKAPQNQTRPERPKARLLAGISIYSILGLIIALLVYSLVLKPYPAVTINSAVYRPAGDYEAAAAKQLKGLNNQNKLTYDENTLEAYLTKRFPEIETISTRIPLIGQQPKLTIKVSKPRFFLSVKGETFVISGQGVVTGRSSDFPGVKGLPVVIDDSGFEAKPGNQVLSARSTVFIAVLTDSLNKKNIKVQSLSLPALPYELHLRTENTPYYTKFFINSEPRQQIGQYLAAREEFFTSGSQPAQYLDVRVPGKIFFK